jgi:hypothetical protein
MESTVSRERGFTLVELLVSTTVTLCATAALLAVVNPARGLFTAEMEASDMQQRLRVSHEILFNELIMAGAGADFGADRGPLTDGFAAILPYHQARGNGDPPGSVRRDAITVMYIPSTKAAQTTIALPQPARSGAVRVDITPGCGLIDAACGLSRATLAIVYDSTGAFDVFKITGVQGSMVQLQHTLDDSLTVYPAGSRIAQAVVGSYFLKTDSLTGVSQLMRDDGDGGPVVPLVDHVVGLTFDYLGTALPPRMRKSVVDPAGPWTTYGPKPPPPGNQPTAYPPGENCVFTIDASAFPQPRLSEIGGELSGGLVPLTASELTDGPWCPDGTASNRYDADLLRIQSVTITVRVESAIDAMRGPASVLFSRRGTSSGNRFLPDQEIRFHVTPRNLHLPR